MIIGVVNPRIPSQKIYISTICNVRMMLERFAVKTKCIELASLPDVLSGCDWGRRCTKPEPEGRGQSAPSANSLKEKKSGWFADKVGLDFIHWKYLLYVWN